jgi:hypothetical protein
VFVLHRRKIIFPYMNLRECRSVRKLVVMREDNIKME